MSSFVLNILLASSSMMESIDGKPLATNLSDLFGDFPYERLPVNNPILAFAMRPEVVLGLILFYLASNRVLQGIVKSTQLNPKSTCFKTTVALHNLALAVYSFVSVVNTLPPVVTHFADHGFFNTYCDPHGTLWNDSGLGTWATIFYLSKYYEFVDSWVLVCKGKEPSFLQIYHHAGIVAIMWSAVASQAAWLYFPVILNSFIHTLMYTYFFIKTIFPTVQIKAARYLTVAQITQFFAGLFCGSGVLLLGDRCDSVASRFSLACLALYGCGLIALFTAFAKRKYSDGTSTSRSTKSKRC